MLKTTVNNIAMNNSHHDISNQSAKDWPSHQTVALMNGSLPMGGVVADTPIHAFVKPPSVLTLSDRKELNPQRHDIALGGLLAFTIDDVVTADEADLIVEASERFGYRQAAPGIATPPGMRMNKSVHWVSDETFLGKIYGRIQHLLPGMIDGEQIYDRFSHRINMYRYDANDVFNFHTDGEWPGFGLSADRSHMVEWPGYRSCMTMLLYLNGKEEGVQGGSTRLYRRDRTWVDVEPKKGSALFFRHGYQGESVMHEGRRVVGSIPKYVARINVLYGSSGF